MKRWIGVLAVPSTGRWNRGSQWWLTASAASTSPGSICVLPTNGWGQYSGSSTTGSITTGTASLTVASATGWMTGDAITVAGAGVGSADLTTYIQQISGTTITLGANASTSVTDAAVTHVEPTWKTMSALGS